MLGRAIVDYFVDRGLTAIPAKGKHEIVFHLSRSEPNLSVLDVTQEEDAGVGSRTIGERSNVSIIVANDV
jgi:hypothetical protein